MHGCRTTFVVVEGRRRVVRGFEGSMNRLQHEVNTEQSLWWSRKEIGRRVVEVVEVDLEIAQSY